MQSSNSHVRDFLSYYCSLKNPPEYAVLIKGLWGAGKTWFIKDCLNNLKSDGQDHLYVSLYGVVSVGDIESEFFRQLHPFLASKSMKLLGKLTKGLLKAAIQLDIDGDGKSDGSITIGVPDGNLLESLKVSDEKVLVFDDIERCAIPICDLLGYINQFVEHGGFKVILIANENEILGNDDENNAKAYRRIKEKLVGKTFEITPEIVPALSHFISQLQCDKAKVAVNENILLVTQIYKSSKYKNLRILRSALWEFDRLFLNLSEKIIVNKSLVTHILSLYLIYSFEIFSGAILPNEIPKIRGSLCASAWKSTGEQDPYKKYTEIQNRYTGIDLIDTIFDDSIWQSIFEDGFIDPEEIGLAINNSKYFQSETKPDWIRLWHATDLSDSDFENVLKNVEKEWLGMSYTEIGIVKHVSGILLWLSDIGIFNKEKNEIFEFSKKYIDHLKNQGKLLLNPSRRVSLFDTQAWGGLQFHYNDDIKFIELLQYISQKEDEALIDSFPEEGKKLLNLVKSDTDKFLRSLILSNHEDNRFYEVPILKYVGPADFVDIFLKLTPDQQRTVGYVFRERYKFSEFNSKLIAEIDFLKDIILLLNNAKIQRNGKISAFIIGSLVDPCLKNAVTRLEVGKTKPQQADSQNHIT